MQVALLQPEAVSSPESGVRVGRGVRVRVGGNKEKALRPAEAGGHAKIKEEKRCKNWINYIFLTK